MARYLPLDKLFTFQKIKLRPKGEAETPMPAARKGIDLTTEQET
jgi:hypothetical protein